MLAARRLSALLETLRKAIPSECPISIQTNGVLLKPPILDVCASFGVSVSVSLDGPASVHDRQRVDHFGRASHAAVITGVANLKSHPSAETLFSGVLAVVDPTSDPTEIYTYLKSVGAPSIDFLYRDGNRTALPFGKRSIESAEYGRWMSKILDHYLSDGNPPPIRLLDDMIKLILGGAGVKEGIGLTDFGIVVVDTDGASPRTIR